MVGYWDTSAIVPLLVSEADTELRQSQLLNSQGMFTWWGTRLECVSALSRREREGGLTLGSHAQALDRLSGLTRQWMLVPPLDSVQARAERLLRVHPLRAADALQLAAALHAVHEQPTETPFFCADCRLAQAAAREGFPVG